MICGFKPLLAFKYAVFHWLLSACVGWLAYFVTLTILSRITGLPDLMGDFSIRHCSLLVALCFSVSAHILQDYWLGWF